MVPAAGESSGVQGPHLPPLCIPTSSPHATDTAMALRSPRRRVSTAIWCRVALLVLLAACGPCQAQQSHVGSPEPAAKLVELTLLTGGREEGVVCLDGSPPGYHLQRGFGHGSNNWLLHLQGGAWCNTIESCSARKMTELGSSNYMQAMEFVGILSNEQQKNPDFYNWNKVVMRYCDGASFSGNVEDGLQNGTKLFFRGLYIWEAVINELLNKGLVNAKQALLTGCSAGGLAMLLHCNNFRARFPKEVTVKCLSDAGFFLDVNDLSGKRSIWSIYDGVVHLQNVSKVLPKECLTKMNQTECFFPAELIKNIKTPMFILNSAYDSWQIRNTLAPDGSYSDHSWLSCKTDIRNCSSTQIEVLHGFRKKLVNAMKIVQDNKGWGMFIDSCFTHCQIEHEISWNSPASPRLGNRLSQRLLGIGILVEAKLKKSTASTRATPHAAVSCLLN